ncbi:glycosyltransferase, partial [candidate division WOR-3 bacterium]|nr:glycosyltransferase [candidate division WOR-3 bacterium]
IVFNELCNDSRVLKHIKCFESNFHITVICLSSNKNTKLLNLLFPNICFKFIHYSGKIVNKNICQYIERQLLLKIYVIKILKQDHFNLIFCNDLETLIPAYFSNIHKPLSIIYDSHEIWTERSGCKKTIIHRFINFCEAHIEKKIVHKIRKIITVSPDIGKYFKEKWKYSKDILILRNIPDTNYSNNIEITRKALNIPEDIKLFVYAGVINITRNIPNLIKAFKKIVDKKNGLLLIGHSDIELKDYLNDSSNVYYINQVPENHLYHYLKIADIGIHPLNIINSLNYKLALPNKVFQYMQAGLALCIFENSATKKIIDNYKNGVYGSMNTLDDIMNNILKTSLLDIEDMKKNSQKAYSEIYNWENEKKSFTKFIGKL